MANVSVSGLSIVYDDRGSGERALLLLPGWCAGRAAFDAVAERLSARHRTLALDWRGHGGSTSCEKDFGTRELVDDAVLVIDASRAKEIVPIAAAHAGFVAIELRRRLGGRVSRIVLVDWIVTEPPTPFLGALSAMSNEATALGVRDQLFAMWTTGVADPRVLSYVRENMGSYPAAMWARAAREIAAAYAREGSPLAALSALTPPCPTLHLYAQPDDPGYLAAQQQFTAAHPWFSVHKVTGRSHFPTIEVPEEVSARIDAFIPRHERF